MINGIGGSTAARELETISRWANAAAPIGRAEREQRLEKARRLMRENNADALLIGAGASLR